MMLEEFSVRRAMHNIHRCAFSGAIFPEMASDFCPLPFDACTWVYTNTGVLEL